MAGCRAGSATGTPASGAASVDGRSRGIDIDRDFVSDRRVLVPHQEHVGVGPVYQLLAKASALWTPAG